MEHPNGVDRTALVVDDDAFVLSALAELLSEEGYDVHTASNGFSALRRAAETRPAIILLDLVMPERSGLEVLKELRSDPAHQGAAIVVVSGHLDDLGEAARGALDGLVPKPFDIDELLQTVHRAVQRAAARRAEVQPVTSGTHHDAATRAWRAVPIRRTQHRL